MHDHVMCGTYNVVDYKLDPLILHAAVIPAHVHTSKNHVKGV